MDSGGHENWICGALLIFVTPTKGSLSLISGFHLGETAT
jgi:hypothetical protein